MSVAAGAPAYAEEMARQQAAALLQRVHQWLEAAAPAVPQTAGVVPMLITAVQLYEADLFPASIGQTQAVIGVLRRVRLTVPTLPPL